MVKFTLSFWPISFWKLLTCAESYWDESLHSCDLIWREMPESENLSFIFQMCRRKIIWSSPQSFFRMRPHDVRLHSCGEDKWSSRSRGRCWSFEVSDPPGLWWCNFYGWKQRLANTQQGILLLLTILCGFGPTWPSSGGGRLGLGLGLRVRQG